MEQLEDRAVPTAGLLDPTFGTDPTLPGRVITDLGADAFPSSVALQPDGKIVAAGSVNSGGNSDFALIRYNPDGSLDATFGSGGTVFTDFAGGSDTARQVLLQADGKIVAVGSATTSGGAINFALARYNADGSLDNGGPDDAMPGDAFGSGGKVLTALGAASAAFSAVLQADGRIVAAGVSSDDPLGFGERQFALARYKPDGSLDASFGADGTVLTDFPGAFAEALSLGLQADGKIVAVGVATGVGGEDFALARYNANGSLDTNFDTDGRVLTDFAGGADEGNDVAIQADGKILIVGRADHGGNTFVSGLVRYNPNGSLDSFFGSGGKVMDDFHDGGAYSVVLQADGKCVVGGYTQESGASYDFGLARFNTDGSADVGFNFDGRVSTDFGGQFDGIDDLVLQPDGKIVAVGRTQRAGSFLGYNFALARYENDPVNPVSFGPPITWNPGGSAAAVAVGDFNGDGNPDLGVANYGGETDSVSVLFGNGDGEFAAPRRFVIGVGALDVAAADFNGDGYDDLAVARQLGSGVNVLLGDANGNLTLSFSLNLSLPWSVAVGDFNEDGNPDLAFGGENSLKVNVLLGNGSGGFGPPATFPISGAQGVVEVGDFNGDGHLDLAVDGLNSSGGVIFGTVSVLFGDGTGNFGNAPTISFSTPTTLLGVGDFNNDGHDDLAVAFNQNAAAAVRVLFGDSTGRFAASVDYAVDGASAGTVADFDGDGYDDLAVAFWRTVNNKFEATMSVFRNDGSGGFGPKLDFPLGLSVVSPFGSVAAGDFNNDGKPDLATGESYFDSGTGTSTGRVSVLLNTTPHNQPPVIADQTFAVAENSANGTLVGKIAASDPDSGQTLSYQITAGNTSNAFAINSSTGQITVANNAVLDYETTSVFTLTVKVTDNGSPPLSSTATVTINLNNVNEAPVNSVPTVPQAVAKNKALTFSSANGNAITIVDPDGNTALIQVTLLVQHGTLSLGSVTGLTFVVGDGSNDQTMTFRGTIAALNAALDGLTYQPTPGFVGSDSLMITTNDLGSGLGDALIDTDLVSLIVQNEKKGK